MKDINEFRGDYYFLSNFYSAEVEFDGITYLNNEAAFQAQKVLDLKVRKEFSELPPNLAKAKGRKVSLRKDWESVKDGLMYEIVLCKFAQNQKLKELLLLTGERNLIEGNDWNDKYWGKCRGEGLNKLGIILKQVRELLKKY